MHVPPVRIFPGFLFTLLLSAAVAAGPLDEPLSGRVVDPDGRPVAGARVLVTGAGLPLQSAMTDDGGQFTIASIPEGRITVRVAAEGFSAAARDVEVSAGARDVGTIALSISALSESIVVSASHVEIPLSQATSSVTVISGAELEARQVHSLADALRTVPGLSVVSTGGLGTTTGVFPRGGESNYTLVLVDGVPANDFGGDFDFGQVSTANIDRIEVVRGPQSALFGSNAIGAVVRIVTRRGGAPSAQASVEGGGFDTSRVSASTAGERRQFEWGASFDRVRSDGMNGERTGAGETVGNDDYERRSGSLAAGWRRSNAWARINLRHSADERGFPGPFGSNPAGNYGGIDRVSRGENQRTTAGLSASLPLWSRVRAQAHAGHNRVDSDFASPFGSSEGFSRRWDVRVQTDVAVGNGVDVSAGIDLQRERAGSSFITGATFQRIPVERRTGGYFVEARLNSRDRLFVVAGLRVEDIHRERLEPSGTRPDLAADDVVSANPRLSAGWIVRGGGDAFTKVRASVGSGIRPPDGFELAFTDNPGLRPERSVSAEAGVDQAFARGRGLIEATAFFNTYDDLIVTVGSFAGSSRYRTDNISNARARGLELAATLRERVRAAAPRPVDLSVRVGYTLLDTDVLAVDGDDAAPPPFTAGQPLLRRPRHQFFADFSMASGPLTAFVRGGGRSTFLDVEPSFGTFGGLFDAAGYHVWSAGAAWRVGRFAEIFGRVENLFDRSYEEAFGFPALGRRATAGLRIAARR